jgi:hypothetical protein
VQDRGLTDVHVLASDECEFHGNLTSLSLARNLLAAADAVMSFPFLTALDASNNRLTDIPLFEPPGGFFCERFSSVCERRGR